MSVQVRGNVHILGQNICHRLGLNVTCCNCRGLSKVLVLSEHWLWNFELGKLEQISGEYEATGKADGIGLLR